MEPHTWQISDHDESPSGQKPCGDEDLATYGYLCNPGIAYMEKTRNIFYAGNMIQV
jgi:hypothetical protein